MGVKETPVNFRIYYRMFIAEYKEKLKEALTLRDKLEDEIRIKYENIKSSVDIYKNEFGVDLRKYKEFNEDKYITGTFYKIAKGLFINRDNNYELVTDLFNLYELATKQKELHDCINKITFCEKCSTLNINEYTRILRAYYTEVHKKLILEGQGYSFTNGIGWICVVRCIIDTKRQRRKMLDFKATKKREQELIAQGKRLYNKEEAEWCKANGIDYEAEDKRVYLNNEYCYQIPLISSKLTHGDDLKLEISDYRHSSLRGKTYEDFIEMCNGDTKKICELNIDMKTKLTLCDKVDKILYTKFIRNENQKPIAFSKTNR